MGQQPRDPPIREGLPWAGWLALLVVLVVDHRLDGWEAPWSWVETALADADTTPEGGMVRDRVQLIAMGAAREARPRVLVMGTSRARRGILRSAVAEALGADVLIGKLAHAGLQPFELRGLVERALVARPDVVVLCLSEYDTHRPLRLVDHTAGASLVGLADLLSLVPAGLPWRERTLFLRLGLASLLTSYRHRPVALATPLGRDLRFLRPGRGVPGDIDESFHWGPDGAPGSPIDLEAGTYWELRPRQIEALDERVADVVPRIGRQARLAQLRQVLGIRAGAHADVQRGLLERAVAACVAAGTDVLIVEMPLHPLAVQQYEHAALRAEFLEWAGELATRHGVEVLTLEQGGPFRRPDFHDLTHLNDVGARRLSEALGRRLAPLLEARRDG